MSMSVDIQTIPQQTLQIVTEGIVASEVCFADTVCLPRKDVKTLSGKAPYMSSTATVRRDENRDLAPRSEGKPGDGGMGSVDYDCLAQMGFFELAHEDIINMDAYNIDAVSRYVTEARKAANLNVDIKLADVLKSTSLNLEFDATSDGGGAWDDYQNSTPYQDIKAQFRKIPGCDTVIIGNRVLDTLAFHPDTVARLSYFQGGFGDDTEVQAVIRHLLNRPGLRVLTFDTFYNVKKEGLGYETEYCFDDGIWIGIGGDLQLFNPNNPLNNVSFSKNVERKRCVEIGHTRYVDIKRHQKITAATFTNILTP